MITLRALWKRDWRAAGGDDRKSRALERLGKRGDVVHGKAKHTPAWPWKGIVNPSSTMRFGQTKSNRSFRNFEPLAIRFKSERAWV